MLTKGQSKMLKMNYYAVLNSRILLYFILFLSIIDLLFFSVVGEYLYIAIFILIGFLTSFFSKNMMVILTIAMVCTNVIRFGRDVRVEGMEDGIDLEKTEEEFGDSDFDLFLEGEKKGKAPSPAPAPSLTKAPAHAPSPAPSPAPAHAPSQAPSPAHAPSSSPSSLYIKDDPSSKLSGLNSQTQSLLEKQQILLKNMDNLDPLLKKAESFMEKFQSLNSSDN